ncbi:hypothetical protein VTK73DRAFT_5994 [Phialemonium thermophilum]|uniref:beta-glucosidase n=1 Tax=Phialemonium thermophilum TaxID=223376 RepID=A0ABR3WLK8_9PEZI
MDLPPGSDTLVEAVAAANPNLVVVNQSGTPVSMPWVSSVPAVVQAWYGGNETGNAIADVLFGAANPSGKLPLSWPVRVEDNPAFINTRVDGGKVLYGEGIYIGYRWYEKTKKEVLFPFGHGLSYTTWELANLVVREQTEASVRISVEVANRGPRDGAEVVQIYVSPRVSSAQRPPKELKGFAKVQVPTGETRLAQVELDTKYACSFWDATADCWTMEEGTYDVLVGNSSRNVVLQAAFDVGKTMRWRGL